MKEIIEKGRSNHFLTVIKESKEKIKFRKDRNCNERVRMVKCLCKCGNIIITEWKHFKSGHTKSCGCIFSTQNANITHGISGHPLYRVYYWMLDRCADKKNKNYGGRGVRVCKKWLSNIMSFYNWAIKNGWKRGLQIDKDIRGNGLLYSPRSCCFVTPKVNSNNTRFNIKVKYKNKLVTLSELSEITKIPHQRLRHRHYDGFSVEEMISPKMWVFRGRRPRIMPRGYKKRL